MSVHVFQIGCQGIGRLGFERFLDLEEYGPIDMKFEGVYCRDFEAEERAERYADARKKGLEFFDKVDELYSSAEDVDGTVLVYDAGPTQFHSRNISESLSRGFHHLTERPPSVTREEHIQERKMSARSSVNYKVDFVERENPVVKKLKEITDEEGFEEMEVFRESSFGIQKLLDPVGFSDVKGGCVLDKMVNDIYVMDLVGGELELEKADIEYVMPKALGGEKVMQTDDASSRELDENTALGMCTGVLKSDETDIRLHSSWMGISEEAEKWSRKADEKFGVSPINRKHREIEGKSFRDEECRFIVLKGERTLLGDLMNHRLYDLESGEEIEVPLMPRDQLYRVVEKALLNAAGVIEASPDEDEIDVFMNALFDIQESCSGELFEEIDSASEKLRTLLVDDENMDNTAVRGVAR